MGNNNKCIGGIIMNTATKIEKLEELIKTKEQRVYSNKLMNMDLNELNKELVLQQAELAKETPEEEPEEPEETILEWG